MRLQGYQHTSTLRKRLSLWVWLPSSPAHLLTFLLSSTSDHLPPLNFAPPHRLPSLPPSTGICIPKDPHLSHLERLDELTPPKAHEAHQLFPRHEDFFAWLRHQVQRREHRPVRSFIVLEGDPEAFAGDARSGKGPWVVRLVDGAFGDGVDEALLQEDGEDAQVRRRVRAGHLADARYGGIPQASEELAVQWHG